MSTYISFCCLNIKQHGKYLRIYSTRVCFSWYQMKGILPVYVNKHKFKIEYIPSNSAGPTPTIIMDRGSDAACPTNTVISEVSSYRNPCLWASIEWQNGFLPLFLCVRACLLTLTTASLVWTMSDITPSVIINRTEYWEPSVNCAAQLGKHTQMYTHKYTNTYTKILSLRYLYTVRVNFFLCV